MCASVASPREYKKFNLGGLFMRKISVPILMGSLLGVLGAWSATGIQAASADGFYKGKNSTFYYSSCPYLSSFQSLSVFRLFFLVLN